MARFQREIENPKIQSGLQIVRFFVLILLLICIMLGCLLASVRSVYYFPRVLLGLIPRTSKCTQMLPRLVRSIYRVQVKRRDRPRDLLSASEFGCVEKVS